jgi:co-chaperonin GroES (HSP10)
MTAVKGTIRPLGDKVIVTDMNFDEVYTKSGLVLLSDNGKSSGLHPRWARVLFVGAEQKQVKVGQWVLMQHGRWTRAHKYVNDDGDEIIIQMIDNRGILMVSDEQPEVNDVRVTFGARNYNIPGA